MNYPLQPEDVKITQGHSGRGLQVLCDCGAVNWNHLEILIALWTCRNCGRVFTHNFPQLVEEYLKQHPEEAAPPPPAAKVPAAAKPPGG